MDECWEVFFRRRGLDKLEKIWVWLLDINMESIAIIKPGAAYKHEWSYLGQVDKKKKKD